MIWRLWARAGYKPDPFLDPALHAAFREHPLVIYDVGAAGQLFSFAPVGDPRSRIVAFEPTPASFDALRNRYGNTPNVDLNRVALGSEPGEATMRVPRERPTMATLRPAPTPIGGGEGIEYFDATEAKVAVETLDGFVGEHPPDFLKLDTEGMELEVLRGGERVVHRHVMGLLTEVLLAPSVAEGIALHELQALLDGHGFILFDVKQQRPNRTGRALGGKKGAIETLYLLYLRDFYVWYEETGRHDRELARKKLLASLAICAGYLYLDYCFELAAFGGEESLLSPDEAAAAMHACASVRDVAWTVPDFRGKALLGLIADYVSYVLHPKANHAVPPMHNNLGNRRSALRRQTPPERVRFAYPIRARNDRDSVIMDIAVPSRARPVGGGPT